MATDRRRGGVVRGPVVSCLSNDAGDIRQCETTRRSHDYECDIAMCRWRVFGIRLGLFTSLLSLCLLVTPVGVFVSRCVTGVISLEN